MEAEAKLPKQDTRTVSRDMIEYVQHMIREHKEDYKVGRKSTCAITRFGVAFEMHELSLALRLKCMNSLWCYNYWIIIIIVVVVSYVTLGLAYVTCSFQAMARDEKNYYQDTPKQIKRKIELYKQCHPEEYAAFLELLKTEQMDTK